MNLECSSQSIMHILEFNGHEHLRGENGKQAYLVGISLSSSRNQCLRGSVTGPLEDRSPSPTKSLLSKSTLACFSQLDFARQM